MGQQTDGFLQAIARLAAQKPRYRLGYSGEQGYCDCIGLVIGALRMQGITWRQATCQGAIHGSNWAARFALAEGLPLPLTGVGDVQVGELVFKYRTKGQASYALPGRYRKGGVYDCGDERDYMHVGVVTGVQPLVITHCSTGGIRRDTALGQWKAHGHLKVLADTAPLPAAPIHQTLRKGDRGEAVRMLQQLLNEAGAALQVDGIFGSKTEAAVRAYQAAHALAVDGIAGAKTFGALQGGSA